MKSLETRFRPHPRLPHPEIFILAVMNFPAAPIKILPDKIQEGQPIEINDKFLSGVGI
ncbi:hypothetical protein [Agrobacterium radiobacter]|uniref:hypothetical protein n=1 Tax=Agrobacterium radiobacter TaxID=362 RepID=UPI0012D9A71A|nr:MULTISPECIES: hypothetical protein [Agrobacterium tumefaciens complex]NIB11293.1 hypothetical protein [Agrobacterium radiobacter]